VRLVLLNLRYDGGGKGDGRPTALLPLLVRRLGLYRNCLVVGLVVRVGFVNVDGRVRPTGQAAGD
jgi:hypothetical protein